MQIPGSTLQIESEKGIRKYVKNFLSNFINVLLSSDLPCAGTIKMLLLQAGTLFTVVHTWLHSHSYLSAYFFAPSLPVGYYCLTGVDTHSPTGSGHTGTGGRCFQGHECGEGTTLPVPCTAGYYAPTIGVARCLACPQGKYSTVLFLLALAFFVLHRLVFFRAYAILDTMLYSREVLANAVRDCPVKPMELDQKISYDP